MLPPLETEAKKGAKMKSIDWLVDVVVAAAVSSPN